MSLHIIDNNKLQSSDLSFFTNVIYTNFGGLSEYPQLKHTKEEILKLLKSDNAIVCLYMVNKKLAAYMTGEIIILNDGRKVFYVAYIFTGEKFRNKGIGSKLMNVVDTITNKQMLAGIMLTCNSEDKKIYDFYLKKGFMPDLILRTCGKYEVMFK